MRGAIQKPSCTFLLSINKASTCNLICKLDHRAQLEPVIINYLTMKYFSTNRRHFEISYRKTAVLTCTVKAFLFLSVRREQNIFEQSGFKH